MQTYTHFLLTAVFHQIVSPTDREAGSGLLAGSVAPDVPLALLSVGYVIDRRFIRRHLPDKTRCSPTFNELYFNNPWWITAYNSLHAPLPLFGLALLGYWLRRQRLGRMIIWFALGCGLHTAVDIFSHVDDGPLLLFPANWRYRFRAPVSYWDPRYGGRLFLLFEHLLDLLLIAILIGQRLKPGGKRPHV